jgi:hypothetical protein
VILGRIVRTVVHAVIADIDADAAEIVLLVIESAATARM